jgi:glycosyltransferase 2 family protein
VKRSRMAKRRSGALVGVAVSAVFLWIAFRGIHFGEVWQHLRAADPLLLTLAIANHTLGIHVRALRWKYLLIPVTGPMPLRPRVAATAIGIAANNVIPLRVGEFARALVLARQTGTRIPAVLGTILMERVFDGLVMVASVFAVMALVSFPLPPTVGGLDPGAAARWLLIVAGSIGALLVLLTAFPHGAARAVESATGFLPESWRRAIADSLLSFFRGLSVLRSPRYFLLSVAWAVGQWIFLAAGFYLGFLAFGMENASFAGAVFLQAIIGFAVSIPSTPGFFGPWEAASRYALGLWGVDDGHAVSFAIAFHTGTYLLMTAIGGYYLWRLGLRWRDLRESTEVVEEAVEKAVEEDVERDAGPARHPQNGPAAP